MRSLLFIFLSAVLVGTPVSALAKVGVGVNTGKIQVEEPLRAGGVYDIPPLVIINTGDEPSFYDASIQYHANQPEIRPERSWFRFSPQTFHLEPGQAQRVEIQLTIPLKTEPGDYFAYLEGRPGEKEVTGGVTSIGIAAAAKLYFTIAPANIFQAVYFRALHFWQAYAPWTYIAVALLAGAIVLVLVRRFFSFNVGLRKRESTAPREVPEEQEEFVALEQSRKPKKASAKRSAKKTTTKRKRKE